MKKHNLRMLAVDQVNQGHSVRPLRAFMEKKEIHLEAIVPAVVACCCPCNFVKSLCGLSNYLIVQQHYDAAQLKKATVALINFTHSDGYAEDGYNN